MKKVIALLVAVVICAGVFVGCGSESTDSNLSSETDSQVTSSDTSSGLDVKSMIESYITSNLKGKNFSVIIKDDDSQKTVVISLDEDNGLFLDPKNCGIKAFSLVNWIKKYKPELDGEIGTYQFAFFAEGAQQYSATMNNSKKAEITEMTIISTKDKKETVVTANDIEGENDPGASSMTTPSTPHSKASTQSKSSNSAAPSNKPSTPHKAEKPSTPPKTETPNTTPPPPTTTVGQTNALKRAKSYLNIMAFSYTGLIKQLEYEKFSNKDAVYAADNCGANWNGQSLKKAKSYLSSMAFSYSGLVKQLKYEGFTPSQASYGADNCGANWNEQAAKKAKSYLNSMSFSRDGLIKQLEYEGYTHAQAVYGVNQTGL